MNVNEHFSYIYWLFVFLLWICLSVKVEVLVAQLRLTL